MYKKYLKREKWKQRQLHRYGMTKEVMAVEEMPQTTY